MLKLRDNKCPEHDWHVSLNNEYNSLETKDRWNNTVDHKASTAVHRTCHRCGFAETIIIDPTLDNPCKQIEIKGIQLINRGSGVTVNDIKG